MQEIRSSNSYVFTEICNPNKSRARQHLQQNDFAQYFAKYRYLIFLVSCTMIIFGKDIFL